ncbi:MAG: hypothetical protein ACWA5A_17485, partial [Marinibacterium sp.]
MNHFGARFGQLIARKREERGLSYAQVALAAYGDDGQGGDTRKRDVQRLEQGGSKKPNAATIKRYRIALDLTQEEIDACRTPAEIELAHFSDKLFEVISEAATQLGINENLAASLVESYALGNPTDFDSALRGVTAALDEAAEMRKQGILASNVDAAVAQGIDRVNEINATGDPDDAVTELKLALDARRAVIEREKEGMSRLLRTQISQARVVNQPNLAIAAELETLTLSGGGFEDLRAVQDVWYERGRDKGLRFDLEVAIGLARAEVDRAADADQRGNGLNDLGIALQTLGERESGTERLEDAVTAYRAAL